MAIVEVNISMSVDGFVTGPNINEHPGLGEGGHILHGWLGEDDPGKILQENLFAPAGAVITSRKVFDGTGGWGVDGFYRMPVYVLTHRPHEPIVKGKTTFTFVTEGVEQAVALAATAAPTYQEPPSHPGRTRRQPVRRPPPSISAGDVTTIGLRSPVRAVR